MSNLRFAIASGSLVGFVLYLRSMAKAKDARDLVEVRRLASEAGRAQQVRDACAAAQEAVLRGNAAAPGLVARCRALGGTAPDAQPFPVGPPGPPPFVTPPAPPAPPAPSLPVQLTDGLLRPRQGPLYRVSVSVHFPLSIGVGPGSVAQQAKDHGFTDAVVSRTPPPGWPSPARADYYVTAHYAGNPTTMARSYAGGQVQVVDAWEGG